MRVLKADELGMCFGVRDALDIARQVDEPVRVTVHGQLVHNPQVNDDLRRRGFHLLDEHGAAPITEQVMITAHGISERRRHALLEAGKTLIDTTCPLVRHVHEAARRFADESRFVIVIGRHRHVEVRGIIEDYDQCTVVQHAQEVRCYGLPKLGIVCQSTTPPELADAVRQRIEALNARADIQYADTICRPTRERLEAIDALLDQVDAVVVVGGRNSNNTNRLAARAEAGGVPVVRIESADELRPDMFTACDAVGLTAGTSTPDDVIDRVYDQLLQINPPAALHHPVRPRSIPGTLFQARPGIPRDGLAASINSTRSAAD